MSSGDHVNPQQLPLPGIEEHLREHPLQTWEMTRTQYEADPQTMWRSEANDILGAGDTDPDEEGWEYRDRLLGDDGWKSSGVHFGDYVAAKERGQTNADEHQRFADEHEDGHVDPNLGTPNAYNKPVRMFSLRAQGRFSNEPVAAHPAAEVLPQTKGVAPDADVGDEPWPWHFKTGRWYLNQAEGFASGTDRGPAHVPFFIDPSVGAGGGTLSGYVPRKRGFLTTHSEDVLQAHAEGKPVHPNILQMAQISPEYSETIEPKARVDRKEGVRNLERPEHPAKLFQTLNPLAGKVEQIDIPTAGGGVLEHYVSHSHAIPVSNEDYDEVLRQHAAHRAGESNEPILGHIGEPRPAGSPR